VAVLPLNYLAKGYTKKPKSSCSSKMYTIYRLTHIEYYRYRKHLKQLDDESRYLRFGYAIKDEVIDLVCDRIQRTPSKHKIFVIEDDDFNVIAAGHISIEDDPVELAFSVLKEHQGRGMGSALMARCIEWCQNRSIKHGCMVCLSHNKAVRAMAKKHGVLIEESGEVEAQLTIPKLNAGSVVHEIAEDNFAAIDHMGKLQKRFARMLTYPLRF
jgi:GNAT superfamily N-acetyltransferase